MSGGPSRFFNSIEDSRGLSDSALTDLFVYYLTVEVGEGAATAGQIDQCFRQCELTPPARTSAHLSKGLKSNPQKFVKVDGGYKLHRHYKEELSKKLGAERLVLQANVELRKLESRIKEGDGKKFLGETIDCFEIGANRAAIVMCWILVMDHLYEVVLQKKNLPLFNAVLSKNTDRRVRVTSISQRDDFGDIPEGKFIEFLRSAGLISNDVRKILEEKLGTRNSSAHPSGIEIKPSKVVEFMDDLIENVILKYPVT